MNLSAQMDDDNIRKIEDVIEIQKAKGNYNYNVRQVAFNLPSETDSGVSTNVSKSLETGLTNEILKPLGTSKKLKKVKSKRAKNPLPDVGAWPSDSDITVLRMKLSLNKNGLKEKVGNVIPGDGLHQTDGSSMINLATLILQSQSPSKHCINVEEYLMPLTSWEKHRNEDKTTEDLDKLYDTPSPAVINDEIRTGSGMSSSHDDDREAISSLDSDYSKNTKTSKMAKFLRLYFCPCCTCLYKLEKMKEEPSACFTKHLNVF